MKIFRKTVFVLFVLWGCLVAYRAKADELKYLARPQESLAGFIRLAESAKTSIDLTTYIFEPCHASAQVFMDVLAKRAQAGVKVRLLLDALGNGNFNPEKRQQLTNYFARYGIQLRFYNDYSVYGPLMNLRMHAKFMVVDGAAYITGGRNISDEYFAMSTKQNWVDRDVYVYGASAAQAVKYFHELWTSPDMVSGYRAGGSFAGWKSYCEGTLSPRAGEVRAFLDAKANDLINRVPARACASVKFLSDAPDFGNPKYGDPAGGDNAWQDPLDTYLTPMRLARKRTTKSLLQFIDATKRRLELENWGYIPVGFLRRSFGQLRDRRVEVRAIVNQDMESGPQFFKEAEEFAIAWLSGEDSQGSQEVRLVSSRGALTDAYELTPPRVPFFLHGKVMVRDRKDAVVSSFNLDARSYSTNLETAVVVQGCPDFAGDVQRETDRIHAVYEDDARTGRVPPKEEPGFFSKLFAYMNLMLL